jgi:hypothetical protein
MAEITSVTSEALQAQLRTLLPSQQGFGEDLQASNVIIPVVDLTSTAEGSSLPTNLQTALAYNSQNSFNVSNTSTTVANTAGFWRLTGTGFVRIVTSGTLPEVTIIMYDGTTFKTVWGFESDVSTVEGMQVISFDYTFYLRSGDSLLVNAVSSNATCRGSVRQIADNTGNLINPSGFTSE